MSTPLDPLPNHSPDALIARVLTGLRDTQPSPGMDDRILHALQRHAEAQLPRRTRAIRLLWIADLPIAAGFTAALLVATLVTLYPHHSPRTTAHLTQPRLTPATPAPPPSAVILSAGGVPSERSLLDGVQAKDPRISLTDAKLSRARLSCSCSKSPIPLAITPPPTDPEAAEALADTLAPSHPAPPIPLTPEEKLLLRVLQRNDPVELAQLDPVQLETALARDQAEYREFFTPPPPPPQDLPPDPTSAEAQGPTADQIQAQTPPTPTPTPGDQQ